MNAVDMPRWITALRRMTAGYDWQMPTDQAAAWFDQLERYPIHAIEQALRSAPAESGRYKPTVGMVEQLAKKAVSDTAPSVGSSANAPAVYRDEDGVVVARWRCVFCEDSGWRAKLTATGQLLTQDELVRCGQDFGPAREDGQPHYFMARCKCRMSGQAQTRGAA